MTDKFILPTGFRAAGFHCGIKEDAEKFDLALFVSDVPSTAAGLFTQNRVCGAPVKVNRKRLPRRTARAVIINSGNANACTGERGLKDAGWMTDQIAEHHNLADSRSHLMPARARTRNQDLENPASTLTKADLQAFGETGGTFHRLENSGAGHTVPSQPRASYATATPRRSNNIRNISSTPAHRRWDPSGLKIST